MSAPLENKKLIVTGAASGIGLAAVRVLVDQGASVVASDVADTLPEELTRAGLGSVPSHQADVSEPDQVSGLVEHAVEVLGGVDGCFANAGRLGSLGPALELSVDDWLEVLKVNLVGTFLCVKEVAKRCREQGSGAIVCTASVAGLRAGAGPVPYSASKAGVINLVQTLAMQLAGTGVRINAVCPGLVETGMTRPLFDFARSAGKEHKIGQLNPTGRAGDSAEIAQVVAFLLSDGASYVNGQAYVVDGGLSSAHPHVPGRSM